MATVNSKTSIKIDELINDTIVSGHVTSAGVLVLTTRGGAEFNAGNVGSQQPIGELWVETQEYVLGDIVSYAGALWKAVVDTTQNEPPSLFTSSWLRLAGEVPDVWSERDPYFSGDDLKVWDFTIKTGLPVVSFTTVPGEHESGDKALKIAMGPLEMQRFFSIDENIVRADDVITTFIRARLLSENAAAKLSVELIQNDETELPILGSPGAVTTLADEGEQGLTEDWDTYVFTTTSEASKPRAQINIIASTTDFIGFEGAVFLIDSIRTVRGQQTTPGSGGGGFELEQTIASASTVWTVVHNQNTKGVNVYTENSLGVEIEGDVTYPDDDTVQIEFYHPQAGLARVFN